MLKSTPVKVCLFLCVLGGAAQADVTLSTSELTVVLSSQRCWTPLSIHRQGSEFCSYGGSGQGTVICEGGAWAGSVHSNEQLRAANVRIGDSPVNLVDGAVYEGTDLSFERVTLLGETFQLRSLLELHGDAITETVTLARTHSPTSVTPVYGFLGSRSNRLTEYATFDGLGENVMLGTTALDNNGFRHVVPAAAMAQFDPVAGEGIVSYVLEGEQLGLQQFIWDRPYDNKLYCRFTDMEGMRTAESTFTIVQGIRFFDAGPQSWVSVAADVSRQIRDEFDPDRVTRGEDIDWDWDMPVEPVDPADWGDDPSDNAVGDLDDASRILQAMMGTSIADTNLDGCVNLLDLGNLADSFNGSGLLTFGNGDTDADHDVDMCDWANLCADYGKTFSIAYLPEPGALTLLVAGGLALIRRRPTPQPA